MTFLKTNFSAQKAHIEHHIAYEYQYYMVYNKGNEVTWQQMKQTPFSQYQVVRKYNQDVCSILKEV